MILYLLARKVNRTVEVHSVRIPNNNATISNQDKESLKKIGWASLGPIPVQTDDEVSDQQELNEIIEGVLKKG